MVRISKLRIKNRGRMGTALILSMLLIIAVALTGCNSATSNENSKAKKHKQTEATSTDSKGVQRTPTVHRVQVQEMARIKKNPRIRAKTRTRIRVRRMRNQVLQAAQTLQVPLPVHHQQQRSTRSGFQNKVTTSRKKFSNVGAGESSIVLLNKLHIGTNTSPRNAKPILTSSAKAITCLKAGLLNRNGRSMCLDTMNIDKTYK